MRRSAARAAPVREPAAQPRIDRESGAGPAVEPEARAPGRSTGGRLREIADRLEDELTTILARPPLGAMPCGAGALEAAAEAALRDCASELGVEGKGATVKALAALCARTTAPAEDDGTGVDEDPKPEPDSDAAASILATLFGCPRLRSRTSHRTLALSVPGVGRALVDSLRAAEPADGIDDREWIIHAALSPTTLKKTGLGVLDAAFGGTDLPAVSVRRAASSPLPARLQIVAGAIRNLKEGRASVAEELSRDPAGALRISSAAGVPPELADVLDAVSPARRSPDPAVDALADRLQGASLEPGVCRRLGFESEARR